MIIANQPIGANEFYSREPMKNILVQIFAAIAALWLLSCAAIYYTMCQPPQVFAGVMAHVPGPVAFLALPFETLWTHARAGRLKVGDSAPDFTLTKLDKSGSIRLSSVTAAHRPAALIFGSYT
jgi:hypothetical protein